MTFAHRSAALPASVLAIVAMTVALLVVAPAPAHADASGFLYSGMYTVGISSPGDENTLAHEYDALASWSGQRQTFAGAFVGVGGPAGTRHALERAWRAQATPILNIEISDSAAAIARGAHDKQISEWAQGLREWFALGGGRSAIFAPLQEMNGDWTRWGCDPASWKAAYARIRDLVRSAGLDETKVRWAFAPNGWSTPRCGSMQSYYPGSHLVDVVGFSAYNYGSKSWDGRAESPAKVFGPYLEELRGFAADKPFVIWQTGTAPESGRDAWLHEMYRFLAADRNTVGVVYFNIDKAAWGGNEWDWRIWYGAGDGRNAAGLRDGMQAESTAHAFPLTSWFQPGAPVPLTAEDVPSGPVTRLSGGSRTGTAVTLSSSTRPSAETVVLARADAYPDALAGGPLAARLRAPVLLTAPSSLDMQTREEITRLGAKTVIILGGTSAVSPTVEQELVDRGLRVERISGPNRFETARLVAERVGGDAAYVVEGMNADPGRGWPDAVAVGALAAHQGRPILLATRNSLPEPTRLALRGRRAATVVGGQGAVSYEVQHEIAMLGLSVDRIAGRNRYDTSRAVVERSVAVGMDPGRTWVATGRNFPDALAASSAVAANGGILMLVDGQRLQTSSETRHLLVTQPSFEQVLVVGGTGVVSSPTEDEIRRITAR